MRFPPTPPVIAPFLEDAGTLLRILHADDDETTRTDRYLHWEKIRYLKPPEGLTPQERWAGLKLRRMAQQQAIPLRDLGGNAFQFSLTGGMFERLHAITMNCGGFVDRPEPVTNPDTRDRYHVSSLVAEAITSSQLEGAAVTRSVAKEMLRTGRKPVDGGERMILNNFLTMRQISQWKERSLTPELVREIHAMITRETLESPEKEGSLRTEEDAVRVEDAQTGEAMHVPPPAAELPARLEALCAFANDPEMRGFLHPVLRSIILHFWLAYDHPFVDGNGRTARALFYWSMLKHGFWLFEFVSISEQILEAPMKYYRAFLHTETDGNDLNYFLLHQLNVILKAIDSLHAYLSEKAEELAETQRMLGTLSDFNHRQVALLRHALRNASAVYTVASHRNSHNVVTQTARNDLENLVEAGLLLKARRGKAFAYRTAPGLGDILKGGHSPLS